MSRNDDNSQPIRLADEQVLSLALSMAEGAIDSDLRSVDHHHLELDRSIRLGAASLGALLVLLGVFSTIRFVPTTPPTIVLGVGALLNLVAVLVWVFTKAGLMMPMEAAVGPNLDVLVEACRDPEWEVGDLQISLLQNYAQNENDNQRFMRSLATGRRVGILLWLGGAILYLIGFMVLLKTALTG